MNSVSDDVLVLIASFLDDDDRCNMIVNRRFRSVCWTSNSSDNLILDYDEEFNDNSAFMVEPDSEFFLSYSNEDDGDDILSDFDENPQSTIADLDRWLELSQSEFAESDGGWKDEARRIAKELDDSKMLLNQKDALLKSVSQDFENFRGVAKNQVEHLDDTCNVLESQLEHERSISEEKFQGLMKRVDVLQDVVHEGFARLSHQLSESNAKRSAKESVIIDILPQLLAKFDTTTTAAESDDTHDATVAYGGGEFQDGGGESRNGGETSEEPCGAALKKSVCTQTNLDEFQFVNQVEDNTLFSLSTTYQHRQSSPSNIILGVVMMSLVCWAILEPYRLEAVNSTFLT